MDNLAFAGERITGEPSQPPTSRTLGAAKVPRALMILAVCGFAALVLPGESARAQGAMAAGGAAAARPPQVGDWPRTANFRRARVTPAARPLEPPAAWQQGAGPRVADRQLPQRQFVQQQSGAGRSGGSPVGAGQLGREPTGDESTAGQGELPAPVESALEEPRGARLGAVVDTPPEITGDGLPPRRPRGAWVTKVLPGSPAEVANLRPGDRIVAVDGRVITSVRDLMDVLDRHAPGDELRLQYARDAAFGAVAVRLAGPDGLARQDEAGEPAETAAESNSVLGGFGSMFGGLFGGQSGSQSPPQQAENRSERGAEPEQPAAPQPSAELLPPQPVPSDAQPLPPPLPEQ